MKKKFESVTHIWVTEASEKCINFQQSAAIPSSYVGQFVLQHPAPSPDAENGVANSFTDITEKF